MKIFLLFLLFFSLSFGKDGHKNRDYEFHMPRDLGYLNLDNEQKEKISKVDIQIGIYSKETRYVLVFCIKVERKNFQ